MNESEYIKKLEDHIEALQKVIADNRCYINRQRIWNGAEEFIRYTIGARYYAHAKSVGNNLYNLTIVNGTLLVWDDGVPERKETLSGVTFETIEDILKDSLTGNADMVIIQDLEEN